MRVLIFTYKGDIDGAGGAVLAKLAFDEVDYVLCESLNLQDRMREYFDIMFDSVGYENYIRLMVKKVGNNSSFHFGFDESEKMMIDNRLRLVQEKVSEYSQKLIFKQMFGLKAGVVFVNYNFRND